MSSIRELIESKAMPETFTQYLKRWLSHSTERGLNNPLVKMPVKRFRKLQSFEFGSLADGGSLTIGTTSDPIARNLLKNFKTRINERGEHCAFLCFGSVEMTRMQVNVFEHEPRTTPNSGWVDDHVLDPPEQYWRIGPYLAEDERLEEVESGIFLPFVHRPLSRYVNALVDRGFTLRRMEEPAPPPGFLAIAPEYPESNTIPRLMVLRLEAAGSVR